MCFYGSMYTFYFSLIVCFYAYSCPANGSPAPEYEGIVFFLKNLFADWFYFYAVNVALF